MFPQLFKLTEFIFSEIMIQRPAGSVTITRVTQLSGNSGYKMES